MNLDLLVKELKEKHNCHTIILYGSYFDNSYNKNSDIDIICVIDKGESYTDARLIDNIFLDGWIYTEKDLENIEDWYHLKDSKLLLDEKGFGKLFLAKIKEISDTVEIDLKKLEHEFTWSLKMLKRIQLEDEEGLYRKFWLLKDLLEYYFMVRGIRFKGSKKSFIYLKNNDLEIYDLFSFVYKNTCDYNKIERLIKKVFKKE
ncbi:MAG: nucleotidyltransferase domain-containing protein [Candidatus Sericytochromatia bacterium]